MAEKTLKSEGKKKAGPKEITFLCPRCEQHKPISEMRTVTRFVPPLLVCQDCARELR
jgi:hypothetical protein